MMNSSTLEEYKNIKENIIKDVRNLSRLKKLKKDTNDASVKAIGNLFRLKNVFDYVHLLYHKCHKINASLGGSYIDSPDWIKNKKANINPIKKIINAFRTL